MLNNLWLFNIYYCNLLQDKFSYLSKSVFNHFYIRVVEELNPYSLLHYSLTPLAVSRHIMFVIFLLNLLLGSFTGTLRISTIKSFKVSVFPSNKSWWSLGNIFSSSSCELFPKQWRKGKVTVWLKYANAFNSV